MADGLAGVEIAVLVAHGFERDDLVETRHRLTVAGATVRVVATLQEPVRSWRRVGWAEDFPVDQPLAAAKAGAYQGLVLPGGVIGADCLRTDRLAVALVRNFMAVGKPVGAIGHAIWPLLEAGAVRDRRVTSFPSLKTDLERAGARWLDQPAVADGCLTTGRCSDDLPEFLRLLLDRLAVGRMDADHAALRAPSASATE